MSLSKLSYLLVLSILPAVSSVANASVHDFGNLDDSADSFSIAHINARHTGTSSNYFNSDADVIGSDSNNFGDNAPGLASMDFSATGRFRHEERDSRFDHGRIHRTILRRESKHTPIASPVPEPETYAMILAGLGLIGLTVRRRKQAP